MFFGSKSRTGYCINCDNRHGCKSKMPPCLSEMAKSGVTRMAGKQYLTEKHQVFRCEGCPFFRTCWNSEEYARSAK